MFLRKLLTIFLLNGTSDIFLLTLPNLILAAGISYAKTQNQPLKKSSVSQGKILTSIHFALPYISWLPHLYIEALHNFQNSLIHQKTELKFMTVGTFKKETCEHLVIKVQITCTGWTVANSIQSFIANVFEWSFEWQFWTGIAQFTRTLQYTAWPHRCRNLSRSYVFRTRICFKNMVPFTQKIRLKIGRWSIQTDWLAWKARLKRNKTVPTACFRFCLQFKHSWLKNRHCCT